VPSAEAVQAAQSAIEAKDVLACRDAAPKMRRAGVALPAPLLALAAFDPKVLRPEGTGTGTPQGTGPRSSALNIGQHFHKAAIGHFNRDIDDDGQTHISNPAMLLQQLCDEGRRQAHQAD